MALHQDWPDFPRDYRLSTKMQRLVELLQEHEEFIEDARCHTLVFTQGRPDHWRLKISWDFEVTD